MLLTLDCSLDRNYYGEMYYVIRFTKVRRRKSDNVPLKTQGRAGTRTVHAHGRDKQKAGSAAPGRVRETLLVSILYDAHT